MLSLYVDGLKKIQRDMVGEVEITCVMNEGRADTYRILLEGGEGLYEEKKSRFIATLRRCESEEEAAAFLEEMKKKYWDARHNCSAFVIGGRGELTRCSDDGEPSGTAGRPMLETLLNSGVRNVAAVVTRYFGGVLLGTGGLVRAYTQAVKAGLENCKTGTMRAGAELTVTTDYSGIGKVLSVLRNRGMEPVSGDYAEKVVLKILVPAEELERLHRDMADATGGKVEILKQRELYFVDSRVL